VKKYCTFVLSSSFAKFERKSVIAQKQNFLPAGMYSFGLRDMRWIKLPENIAQFSSYILSSQNVLTHYCEE